VSGLAFASLFYGVAPIQGQLATSFAEAASVPAVSPYTATCANSTTFADDYGVVYAATGLPLVKVAANPTIGQYMVSAGIYTFAAGDSGRALLLTYTYQLSAAGQKFAVTNQLLGTTPTFQAQFFTTFQGQAVSLKLNNCTSSKLSLQTKLEDFTIPEFDFSCFADATGTIMTWSFAEAS
jgi:hypothetical protein